MLTHSECQCGHAHSDQREPDDPEGEEEEDDDDQPAPSLAYQLWHPWRLIVMVHHVSVLVSRPSYHDVLRSIVFLNPVPVLIVFILGNTIFVTVGGLVRFLAHYLTIPGLVLPLVLALVVAVRRLASILTYPGQLQLVIREGEAFYARLLQRRLDLFTEAALELAKVLDTTHSEHPNRLRFLGAHQKFMFALETMVVPLIKSLEIVERDGQLGTRGQHLLTSLQDVTKLYAEQVADPCLSLCSASDKAFETQRPTLFHEKNGTDKGRQDPARRTGLPTKDLHPLVEFGEAVRRLQSVIPSIGRPKTDATATRSVAWIFTELCRSSDPNVDSIATLDLLRAEMTVHFRAEQIWLPGYQGHQVDAMLMPPASSPRRPSGRSVVILCNPNGGLYEFHHLQMDWIKFYTEDVDCHVLVYNYRGYGRCKGSPSPTLHNLDAMAIIEYLKTERGMECIAVHGESIGGLVATYVGSRSPHVRAIIADRTFATVPALAQRLIARWAGTVVDWVMQWETDNVHNYLEAACAKLLCSDPCDAIIVDGASLKSGVALRVELGEKTFELPRERPHRADVPARSNCKLKPWVSRTRHRIPEASSEPLIGQRLSETMVARFSDAVVSLGKRAFAVSTQKKEARDERGQGSDPTDDGAASSSHISIAVKDAATAPRDEDEMETEKDPMLASASPLVPPELLTLVWIEIARVDGYCGQLLLEAAENGGHDHIRAWTASLLTWGGRLPRSRRKMCSVAPLSRNERVIVPLTLEDVHGTLQEMIVQYPSLKLDDDVRFVVVMIEYLNYSLHRRWHEMDKWLAARDEEHDKSRAQEKEPMQQHRGSSLRIDTGDPRLGCLLPLHCGHNKCYDDAEKQALLEFLRQAGFQDAVH
ncbi:hypothetical protein PsorP6_003171 [Peronosclerospora sorghi]|uniref:Uncharacterized protein n=1 Tax=Peronosclerospora sorghi TaxID=230839 RepID=A0ACC0VPK2_9STRA|nr:hypothetical protein PsorP6_003171 [Peronosclerospora sorghi]